MYQRAAASIERYLCIGYYSLLCSNRQALTNIGFNNVGFKIVFVKQKKKKVNNMCIGTT